MKFWSFLTGGMIDEEGGFAFSIPSNSKGLKFICRESFVGGDSAFNYPLSSRFEEMDSMVVFDNVLVPWERVFYYDNSAVANSFQITELVSAIYTASSDF